MGYALPSQIAAGLHQRLYARSYIVSNMEKTSRVVFVTADCGMGSQIIKLEVVKKLKEIYGETMYEFCILLLMFIGACVFSHFPVSMACPKEKGWIEKVFFSKLVRI